MTRKELIQLAREAGLDIPDDNPAYNLEFNLEELGVFVELVKEQQQSWIASLEQNARDADRMYKELETELAAAQAQLKDMRSRLGMIVWSNNSEWQSDAAREILDTPTDSALREMLAAERERCAKVCEKKYPHYDGSEHPCFEDAEECAAAIRAMGSE